MPLGQITPKVYFNLLANTSYVGAKLIDFTAHHSHYLST